jgi:hypothetical protein
MQESDILSEEVSWLSSDLRKGKIDVPQYRGWLIELLTGASDIQITEFAKAVEAGHLSAEIVRQLGVDPTANFPK